MVVEWVGGGKGRGCVGGRGEGGWEGEGEVCRREERGVVGVKREGW